MKIIDAHLHLFPQEEPWAEQTAQSVGHHNNWDHLRKVYGELHIVHGVVMGNRSLEPAYHQYPADLFHYCVGLDSALMDKGQREYYLREQMRVIAQELDEEAMRRAADRLLGTHDFRAFSSYRRTKKSTVRTLERIGIERRGEELRLSFTGDGFLYHMVRILTGTLIEVGLHRREPEEMEGILASLDREQAGFTAPAQGLCLVSVEYE